MAPWSAEFRCRALMAPDLSGRPAQTSQCASERDRAGRMVVDLYFALREQGPGARNGVMSR
ncbi:hypothetical protein ACH41H_27855 [Streptomyces sp. NPDC020800]|uniref:hypothetical protein n=1 Tax=Streptomyces sp. NPDC020800 TaxID=3365092 RepID=UPI0037913912